MRELIDLEEQGWRALSSNADAARDFYGRMLLEDAVMVFPGRMRIRGREAILASLAAQPWESFRITHADTVSLTTDVATLVYEVVAQRAGNAPYSALVSSTYVRSSRRWRLAFHQQTPG